MNDGQAEETLEKFSAMTIRQLGNVLLLAGAVGIATWGFAFLMDTYVFHPLLCQGSALRCGQSLQYGTITAAIVAAIFMLLALVRFGVFRPLLVVLAAAISLWGLVEMVHVWPWYLAALATAALYSLAYGTYSWVARIRNFWAAVGILLILLVAVRFFITS